VIVYFSSLTIVIADEELLEIDTFVPYLPTRNISTSLCLALK
jgi:hypothetical protein